MHLYLHPEIKHFFTNDNAVLFDEIMRLQGVSVRKVERRHTQKITLGEKPFFIKQHFGVGWKEIIKNLLQLRLPVVSAANEWQAIQSLHKHNVPTLEWLGYGSRYRNPAAKESFLITRELPAFITLEDFCKDWRKNPPGFCVKYKLIKEIARISRTMHQAGINHRDFYICHFLLDLIEYSKQSIKLYLIDLHRAQIRSSVPERWLIKDLAGLYFSSMEIGLTRRDLFRFMKCYRESSLRDIFNKESYLWQRVQNRAKKLFEKEREKQKSQ